jgi:hypothetical protein
LGLPLCTKFALEGLAVVFPRVSFALAFSSTSRVAIRSSKVNSFLLCFREVLGVSENSEGIPEHRKAGTQNTRTFKSGTQFTKEETKNLQKTTLASKVVNPFTRAFVPPFIGRQMDFYIPKVPSNLRNIPNVNMYMNVLYIP